MIQRIVNIFKDRKLDKDEREIKELKNALQRIINVTNQASIQTKRLKWIRGRAKCALYGGDVRALSYPTNRYKPSSLGSK